MASEYVERAYQAARMGVSTAVIIGDKSLREDVVGQLHDLAKGAKFLDGAGFSLWTFDEGGELFVTSNLLAARSAYIRRHPHGPPLETVYPKDGNL